MRQCSAGEANPVVLRGAKAPSTSAPTILSRRSPEGSSVASWVGTHLFAVVASMRIAISGSHRTGKSTLLEELSERLPRYSTVEEPYVLLEEEGYSFATPPTLEDYEAQLERSLECMKLPGRDILFDRCPADFLGYALSHEDTSMFEIEVRRPCRLQPVVIKNQR